MTNQFSANKDVTSHQSWLFKLSGTAALITGCMLIFSLASLIAGILQPGITSSQPSLLQANWLIVIFKLHAGFSGVHIDLLHILNLLDITILAFVGLMFLGLYATLRRVSQFWSIVAMLQPFLGIILFIITKSAGRSGVMGGGLVISLVMLKSGIFRKTIAYIGILASVLLLAGDFSAGAIPPLTLVAGLFGLGYIFFILWCLLIAKMLIQIGAGDLKEKGGI